VPLMKKRKIYKLFNVGLACSLIMIIATKAITDSPVAPYSLRLAAGQGNAWTAPQAPKSWEQQNQTGQKQNQNFRFVTPEILESIKQQQTQNQLMPENRRYPPRHRQPSQYYGYPSPGMGVANPLYDTPAVSPWGSSSDNLYGGESPLVPKEAIGGFSPFNVMPFSGADGLDGSGTPNVFNPFSFGRDGNSP
jgi:hypothetical protein